MAMSLAKTNTTSGEADRFGPRCGGSQRLVLERHEPGPASRDRPGLVALLPKGTLLGQPVGPPMLEFVSTSLRAMGKHRSCWIKWEPSFALPEGVSRS